MVSKWFIASLAGILMAAGLAYKAVEYKSTHDGPLKIVRYEPQEDHQEDVSELASGKGRKAVYFSAVWCMPCKQFLPIVKKEAWFSGIDWYYADVTQDHNEDIARKLGVFTGGNPPAYQLPHIIFLRKGEKVGELIGFPDRNPKETLEKAITDAYKK